MAVGSTPGHPTALVLGPEAIWGDERGQLRILGRDPRWTPPFSTPPVPVVGLSRSLPLVSLHQNGLLRIWNQRGETRLVGGTPLALHPDGTRTATVVDGTVWIWEVAQGAGWCLGEMSATRAGFGGERVVLVQGERVDVWDLETRTRIYHGSVPMAAVAVLSMDGAQLAVASGADGRVVVVDLETGEERVLDGEGDRHQGVASLCFSTDGQKLGIGGVGAWAERWELDAVGGGQHFPLPADGIQIAMGPDGKMAGLLSYEPLIWFSDGEKSHARLVPVGNGRCLSFLGDGRVVSAGADGNVRTFAVAVGSTKGK